MELFYPQDVAAGSTLTLLPIYQTTPCHILEDYKLDTVEVMIA